MLILAFDTATPAVTVGLHDGQSLLAEDCTVDARRHGELLAPSIGMVLAKAGASPSDLTLIAVGTGPGPYTGLRVGLMTAQAMAFALGIAAHGVCSLDVIAAQAARSGPGREFIVATDARRGEVYWASYAADGSRVDGPQVSLPALVPAGHPVAGQGPRLHPELAGGAEPMEPCYPSAAQLAQLAAQHVDAGLPASPPAPLYLRRPDAREPGRPKRVTP